MWNEWLVLALLLAALLATLRPFLSAAFPSGGLRWPTTVRLRIRFPEVRPQQYFLSPPPPIEEAPPQFLSAPARVTAATVGNLALALDFSPPQPALVTLDSPHDLLALSPSAFRELSNNTLKRLSGWAAGFDYRDELAEATVASLMQAWRGLPSQLSHPQWSAIATCLGRLGYGMEPDVRSAPFIVPRDQNLVVFRLPLTLSLPSRRYHDASAVANLVALWYQISGQCSLTLLKWAEMEFDLSQPEALRLRAYAHWLLMRPRSLAKLRVAIDAMSDQCCVAAIEQLTSGPVEVRALESLFRILNLEKEVAITA